ncbi:MAG: heme-dependent peroxidase [Acidobacteria bacterium]|nr:heme-dependent peroxidase [Acidobacteriota bacterium]
MASHAVAAHATPNVPLTLEGSWMLHQLMRWKRAAWRALTPEDRAAMANEAASVLTAMGAEQSAVFSMLGHKGDLMFVHFRRDLDGLNRAELALSRLPIWDYLEATTSYVSVVELGLYESTARIYRMFGERGLEPGSDAWDEALAEELARQRKAMEPRLYPAMPDHRYACFYPMDRRRGEEKNWYMVPFADRARMMHEHGMVGRKYQGIVRQIISGSVGLDDWEWGVTLFAGDPLQFKKLIYEMRFDEVSAVYAGFGQFYVGLRVTNEDLPRLLAEGELA